jgi:hypothetical protein
MKTAVFLFVVLIVVGVFIAQHPAGKLNMAWYQTRVIKRWETIEWLHNWWPLE